METENIAPLLPDFVPNPNAETFFPWEDVMACFQEKLDENKMIGKNQCPLCCRNSEKLLWIKFKSPEWTWENLCGRAGNLSICPDCRIQVQFQMTMMN